MKGPGNKNSERWGTKSLLDYIQSQLIRKNCKKFKDTKELTLGSKIKEDYFPLYEEEDLVKEHSKWTIHPESSLKLVWDSTSMLLIVYQTLAIPYQLAFEMDEIEIWAWVDLLITMFFFIDIGLSLNTAFYQGGTLIFSRRLIVYNYMKKWFWVDFLTTIPYDLVLNGGDLSQKDMSNAAQLFRILKFYRILRLVRLAKLKKIIEKFEDYISNNSLGLTMVFLKLLVLAFFIAHWVACLWFYLYTLEANYELETWVSNAYIEHMSNFELYTAALYWAFTTMTTVGYGDIKPVTSIEYLFSIVAMTLSCAVFAYFVGSISGLVSKSTAEYNSYREHVLVLNAYMKKKQFPKELIIRVRRYLDYLRSVQQSKDLGENEILSFLSEPLQKEIFIETRGKIFSNCKIFRNFPDPFLLPLLKALNAYIYAPEDEIFKEGERTSVFYHIKSGTVELYHEKTKCLFQVLNQGQHFGEIAFFTLNARCCSARCQEFVELLALSRENTQPLLEQHPEAARLFDYYLSTKDLAVLHVKCYFCAEIGHVAAKCPRCVFEVNSSIEKENHVAQRHQPCKVKQQQKVKKKKKVLKRHPGEAYKESDGDIVNSTLNFTYISSN